MSVPGAVADPLNQAPRENHCGECGGQIQCDGCLEYLAGAGVCLKCRDASERDIACDILEDVREWARRELLLGHIDAKVSELFERCADNLAETWPTTDVEAGTPS